MRQQSDVGPPNSRFEGGQKTSSVPWFPFSALNSRRSVVNSHWGDLLALPRWSLATRLKVKSDVKNGANEPNRGATVSLSAARQSLIFARSNPISAAPATPPWHSAPRLPRISNTSPKRTQGKNLRSPSNDMIVPRRFPRSRFELVFGGVQVRVGSAARRIKNADFGAIEANSGDGGGNLARNRKRCFLYARSAGKIEG